MKFDVSKVYTSVNADEVKVGSIGYFANIYNELKRLVIEDVKPQKLTHVFNGYYHDRFQVDDYAYNLFYLVEEPESEIKEESIEFYKHCAELEEAKETEKLNKPDTADEIACPSHYCEGRKYEGK